MRDFVVDFVGYPTMDEVLALVSTARVDNDDSGATRDWSMPDSGERSSSPVR